MINDLILIGIVIAWSIQKIIDKRLLNDSSSKSFNEWTVIVDFILVIPFFFFAEMIELKYLIIIFLFSFFGVLSSRLLFKGMKKDEVSRVTPFSQFSTLFAIILSVIFLSEKPGTFNVLGIILMVVGGFIISFENGFKDALKFRRNHFLQDFINNNLAIILVLISAFISSLNIFINKIILFNAAAFSLFFFRRMFNFVWVSPAVFKKPTIKNWPLFISSRILSGGGLLMFFYVLSKQDIYLTVPILAMQPLIVLFLSHRLLDEKKYFAKRLIAIIILIVGYILLKL